MEEIKINLKKMKKIFFVVLVGLILITLLVLQALALDAELPIACGGDSELIIACLGDEELIWLGIASGNDTGGGGSMVTPPGEVYTHISFDIFGSNTGNVNITNVNIVDAYPEPFNDSLPTTTQILEIGDDKLLWNSSLIQTKPLEAYPQPITFWVNISGWSPGFPIFYELASIDLTIEPWEEGEEGAPASGFAIFFLDWDFTLEDINFVTFIKVIIIFVLFILFLYFIKRRRKKRRRKKEEKERGIIEEIGIKGVKKKVKRDFLIDMFLIIIMIILLLLLIFLPLVKEEEKIKPRMVVHYYKGGIEVFPPTAEASSSNLFFIPLLNDKKQNT